MGKIKDRLSYLNRGLFCILAPIALLLILNKIVDMATWVMHPLVTLTPIPGVQDSIKEIPPFPVLLAQGSIEIGEKVSKKCISCHTFDQGGAAKTGPNLWNILNRKKGTVPGFAYSEALTSKGGTWTYEDLDQWLTNPQEYAKGSKMVLMLRKPTDRANVILYLRSLGQENTPLPPVLETKDKDAEDSESD